MKKAIVIFIILLIIGSLFVPQIWLVPFFKIKFSKAKKPELYKTVIQREIKPSLYFDEEIINNTYSFYDFTFKVPWKDLVKKNERQNVVDLTFNQNKRVIIFDPKDNLDMVKNLFALRSEKDQKKLRNFFGDDILKSNYSFCTIVLNITPEKINIFNSSNQIIVSSILLTLKAILPPSSTGEIYNFEAGDIKGFQFGDPKANKPILIWFFDKQDKQHELIISGTQQEIDFILSSIKVI